MSRRNARKKIDGFTLSEVIITMFLLSVMCLGVFVGLQQVTKAMMAVAIRDEAYHLLQAEAERLLSADYTSFTNTSADQVITSAVKTSFTPSAAAQFSTGTSDGSGRIAFTRRVVSVASNATSRTLRVEVEWSFAGRSAPTTRASCSAA